MAAPAAASAAGAAPRAEQSTAGVIGVKPQAAEPAPAPWRLPDGSCPSGHGPNHSCGYCTEQAALAAAALEPAPPPPASMAAVLDLIADAALALGGEPAGISLGAALHTVTVQVRTLAEFTGWAGRLATTATVHGGDAYGKWSRAHADLLGWDAHVMLIGDGQ